MAARGIIPQRIISQTPSLTNMMTPNNIKILHLLSQRPDSTGSGIYIQDMLREAEANGNLNYLIAGIQSKSIYLPSQI